MKKKVNTGLVAQARGNMFYSILSRIDQVCQFRLHKVILKRL